MQTTDFRSLQANLSEIYAAAFQSTTMIDNLPLIATSSSTVSYTHSVAGQISVLYTRVCQWMEPPDRSIRLKKVLKFILTTLFDHAVHAAYHARQKRMWNNMRHIDEIWKTSIQMEDLDEQRKRYDRHLLEELKGSVEVESQIYLFAFDERVETLLSQEEEKQHRHLIINFHQATSLFWSVFMQNQEDDPFLNFHLVDLLDPDSTLKDRALFNALKKERDWVQMEGLMQTSIPVALIAKLGGAHPLTPLEKRKLQLWVKTLNDRESSISSQLFFSVLHEIFHVIQLQGSSNLTFFDLLDWLNQQGCTLLYREDPLHMDWREGLCVGDAIDCNRQSFILGEQLSSKKIIDDRFKIFRLKDYPDYVVKIANNPFLLLMDHVRAASDQEHCLIHLVETINEIEVNGHKINGLDREGKCVILERLSSPLSDRKWRSNRVELKKEEETAALIFANHISCMIQWKVMPETLSFSHLMWDSKGVLKSTRLLKKMDADYDSLESYCQEASNGNRHVLNFLMRVSGLDEHPVGIYYRQAVAFALRVGKLDLIGRALPLEHRHERYELHAEALCHRAIALRERCFKRIIGHLRAKKAYCYKQEAGIKKKMVENLAAIYRDLPTPGKFSSDFEERVIEHFLHSDEKQTLIPDLSKAEEYYQQKIEDMKIFNHACL